MNERAEFRTFRRFTGLHAHLVADLQLGACLAPWIPPACITWIDPQLVPALGDIVGLRLPHPIEFGGWRTDEKFMRVTEHGGERAYATSRYTLRLPDAEVQGVLVAALALSHLERRPELRQVIEGDAAFIAAARASLARARLHSTACVAAKSSARS